MRCVEAKSHGGASVLNAVPTGIGSAFALDLEVNVRACENGESNQFPSGAVEKVYEVMKERYCPQLKGISIEVKSTIPPGGGLKSSSAVTNATAIALARLCGLRLSPFEILRIAIEGSKRAGVTITGALDDASASLLGGWVVTNNFEMEILQRRALPELPVIVIPRRGRKFGFDEIKGRLSILRRQFEEVEKMVMTEREPWNAMTLNGLLVASALGYSTEPILTALSKGALAASISGNGPSYVIVTERDNFEEIYDAFKAYDRIGSTITNEKVYYAY